MVASRALLLWSVAMPILVLLGCSAFNPAFLSLVTPAGTPSLVSIPNAPGHVIVSVINKAQVDERLVSYLSTKLGLTPAQTRNLHPRIRLRARITFVDGSFEVVEFVTGSGDFIDPAFSGAAFPDLNQNDLDNVVVECDVARVELEPGTNVEVFVPVELTQFELVQLTTPQGGVDATFQERQRIPPGFIALRVDDIDADNNTLLPRNIGIRDVLSPTPDLRCGSVVAIIVDGTLAVPFLDGVSEDPSYDIADIPTIAQIGGRYEFIVSVQ